MTELLGSIGWGLLAFGAFTHVWHHDRLRALLSMHLDHERLPAVLLTVIEVVLAIAIAVTYLADHQSLQWFSLAAGVVAIGFVAWIARLLFTGSELPCACSFSEGATTRWSLLRALCVTLVMLFATVAGTTGSEAQLSEQVATLVVGWAVAAAIFVLPEAITWPDASKALLTRVNAHTVET